jgi:2-polyprenyl-3-methyl-5-hydroxy-6-metoxy-1,4-benzoquinol methylase
MILPETFHDFETITQCPICGSASRNRAFEPDVERCKVCRCYFRNPRPTQADIQRSYDCGANYRDWALLDPMARRGMWDRRLQRLRSVVKPGATLLDVGAGDGYFLDIAKEEGFVTTGTELSETGANLSRERGHEILLGQLEEIDFQGRTFDAVTLWHVLEHLPDPGRALAKVHARLKPGGVFALAVPNEENHLFRHRWGMLKTANPLGPLVWGAEIHLSHFQPATLRGVLNAAGFQVLRFGVDDIYQDRSGKNLAKLTFQKALNALLAWHFSMAMYCICRKL